MGASVGPSIPWEGLSAYMDAANERMGPNRNLLTTTTLTSWVTTRCSIVSTNEVIAPDGISSPFLMTITDPSGLVRLTAQTASSSAIGQTHCFSIYVKQKNSTAGSVNIGIYNSGQTQGAEPGFLIQSNFDKQAAYPYAGVESVGNGWYRLYANVALAGVSAFSCFFDIESSPGGTKVAGEGLYIWGPQLEVASTPSNFFRVGIKYWPDMTGNVSPFLVNGPSYTPVTGGIVFFDGVDDRVNLNTPFYSSWTTNVWMRSNIFSSPIASQPFFNFTPASGGSSPGSIVLNLNTFYNVAKIETGPSGGIYVGGQFAGAQDITRGFILKLNDDGTLDQNFNAGLNNFGGVFHVIDIVFDSSDTAYLAGTNIGNLGIRKISAATGGFISNPLTASGGSAPSVTNGCILLDIPSGKLWTFGFWALNYNGNPYQQVIKLNISDYSVDTTFDSATGFNNALVYTGDLDANNDLYLGGDFTQYKGNSVSRIVKINGVNASLDTSFSIGSGFNNSVRDIVIQSDGKILVCGNFTSYNGNTRSRIVRLNTDGSIDSSFNIGTGLNGVAYEMAIQSDGKIVVVGEFTNYNGNSRNRILRLNTDGSIDTSFNIGTGLTILSQTVKILSDGKILVGVGGSGVYNGNSVTGIFRINSDGSFDNTFNIGSGINLSLYREDLSGRLDNSSLQLFSIGSMSGNSGRVPASAILSAYNDLYRMYTLTFTPPDILRVYRDGQLRSTVTTAGNVPISMQQSILSFGGYVGTYFLYNRALSNSEITSLYNSTKNRFGR